MAHQAIGWRYVLDKHFHLDEPEPDEDLPMTWDQPGNEVAVDQSHFRADPPGGQRSSRERNAAALGHGQRLL